ncbi:MAG: hypothetical protein ACRDBG_07785 [Waterburya sp.]
MLAASDLYLNFDDSSPDPILSIPQSSVALSINWNGVATDNLEPWLMGLLQLTANYSANETDELANVFVTQPIKSDGVRDGQGRRTYTYTVTFFLPDSMPEIPDGDDFL